MIVNKEINQKINHELSVIGEFKSEQSRLDSGVCKWNMIKDKRFKMSYEHLKEKYEEIVQKLNVQYPKSIERTSAERRFLKSAKLNTNLKVRTSVWIGVFNYDMLLVQIGEKGSSAMKGLVIEIDGSVHDKSVKMSKDQLRYQLIHLLGIGLHSVANSDINSTTENYFYTNLRFIRRIDHRARLRLLWNIHLLTICCFLTAQELSHFFNVDEKKLFKMCNRKQPMIL
jgi:very-short-patch-repair endonuclease